MKKCRFFIPYLLFMICSFLASAQISVSNPSFEDEPADATTPQEWYPCDDLTTPDIFPGFWGVYNEASHGETYVGIITRENGTFERFGQKLSAPLKPNQCYLTSIDLSHSKVYSGYNKPIRLRVILGNNKCGDDQIIFESKEIKHTDWKTYKIEFTPKEPFQYIKLEAFYKEGTFSHKGNILMDNLRPIRRCGNA